MAKMTLDDLVSQLRAALGSELRTVALYGSAAAGEHYGDTSDYNLLVVVDSLAASRLDAASAAIAAWTAAGNTAPLMLTAEEWSGSADIFAMEYADILERHRLLHGEFPATVRVDPHHLRLQLEHEAMGALLQLRRGSLAAGRDGKALLRLLEGGTSTLLALLRAVVRLRGEQPPRDNVELSTAVARLAGADATPFVRLVQHRRGNVPLKPADAAAVVAGCLDGLQRVVRYLDQFKGRP